MRYTQYLFTRFFCRCAASACLAAVYAIFAALSSCTNEACGGEDVPVAGGCIPLSLEITASGFTGLQPDASPHTRTSENDYTTSFDASDAIGLFAVKGIGTPGAAMVDGISNSKLTYAPAVDVAHKPTWQPADAATTLYYYPDVTYIAYYPYKDGITIDPTQSKDAILASFAEKAELQPATDQSTFAAYAASGLMTASGTATDTDDPNRKTLSLSFTHSYALLVLKTKVPAKCVAPAGSVFEYRPQATVMRADPAAANVVIRDVKAYKLADGEFRTIIKPVVDDNMRVSYTTNGMIVEYNEAMAGLAAVTTGQYYECVMNTSLPGTPDAIERALQPGDFVYQNNGKIEIYPGDGPVDADGKIPDYTNAVGIVVTTASARMTDAECNTKGWNHAYVMGFDEVGDAIWGVDNVDETVLPNTTFNDGENNMNGYSETEAMLAERANKGDISSYPAFNKLNDYRNNHPVPSALAGKRSPWFIPSIGQWFDLLFNLGGRSPKTFRNNTNESWSDMMGYGTETRNKINGQLNKLGKPINLADYAPNMSFYMLSSESNAADVWYATWLDQAGSSVVALLAGAKPFDTPSILFFRPFFAF